MRQVIFGTVLAVAVLAGWSCGGGGSSGRTATAVPGSPTIGPAPTETPDVPAIKFPEDCGHLVSAADVSIMMGIPLRTPDAQPIEREQVVVLICKYSADGRVTQPAEQTVNVAGEGFIDAATAQSLDADGRAKVTEQGGTYTPLTGVADEAYSFVFPNQTGVVARRGRYTASIGIGKSLPQPKTDAITALVLDTLARLEQ